MLSLNLLKTMTRSPLSNLTQRILFAVPAAAIFIWMTWLGGWFFQGMIIIIGFFIIQEVIRILDNCHTPADILFPYTIGLWVMLSHTLPYPFEIGVVILVLFLAIQTFNQSSDSHLKLSTTLFAGLYAPLGLLCFVLINKMGSTTDGFIFTIILLLMVWGSDVFAYFGGKTFGKHALAPDISPNKTWEFSLDISAALLGLLQFIIWCRYPCHSTSRKFFRWHYSSLHSDLLAIFWKVN